MLGLLAGLCPIYLNTCDKWFRWNSMNDIGVKDRRRCVICSSSCLQFQEEWASWRKKNCAGYDRSFSHVYYYTDIRKRIWRCSVCFLGKIFKVFPWRSGIFVNLQRRTIGRKPCLQVSSSSLVLTFQTFQWTPTSRNAFLIISLPHIQSGLITKLHTLRSTACFPVSQADEPLPNISKLIKQNRCNKEIFIIGGLDLVLVPGLGFTVEGYRIGRGKGYYDRYLYKCSQTPKPPVTIGLAFREQIVPSIPTDGTDVKLDHVFYDNSTWYESRMFFVRFLCFFQ